MIPEYRDDDMATIRKLLPGLSEFSFDCYEKCGRGAIVVAEPPDDTLLYVSQAAMEKHGAPDREQKMVLDYDPSTEFVVAFQHAGDMCGVYRIQIPKELADDLRRSEARAG